MLSAFKTDGVAKSDNTVSQVKLGRHNLKFVHDENWGPKRILSDQNTFKLWQFLEEKLLRVSRVFLSRSVDECDLLMNFAISRKVDFLGAMQVSNSQGHG